MKNVFISIVVLLSGCSIIDKDQDLPGIYTGKFEHEFAKNEDTLIIKRASDGKGVYQIFRHTGMRKIIEGKLSPKKTITEDFVAEYNTESQVLTDIKAGRKYFWDRGSHSILSGKTRYNKSVE